MLRIINFLPRNVYLIGVALRLVNILMSYNCENSFVWQRYICLTKSSSTSTGYSYTWAL